MKTESLLFLLIGCYLLVNCGGGGNTPPPNPNEDSYSDEHFQFLGLENWSEGVSIAKTNDEGFVMAGINNRNNFGLSKFDENCNTIWDASYGGSGNDFVKEVISLNDSNDFLLVGGSRSFGGGNNVYIVKTTSSGNEVWSKTFGREGTDAGNDIIQTEDGGFLITGYSGPSGFEIHAYIIKIDEQGREEWSKTFSGDTNTEAWNAVEMNDGSFIITIARTKAVVLKNLELIKLDAKGKILWSKELGPIGSSIVPIMMKKSLDNNLVIFTTSNETAGGDLSGLGNFLLMKVDVEGNKIWESTYGGENVEIGNSMVELSNGDIMMIGLT